MSANYSMKCRCLPHGFFTFIPTLLSTIGWISALTKDGCNYAILEGPMVTDITSNPEMPFLEVGIAYYREPSLTDEDTWAIDYNQVCKNYNIDIVDVDGVWVFTKITSFLALVFCGAGVLLIWFSTCFIFSKKTWRWVGCELLTATLFKLLSFSWLATRMCTTNGNKCSIHYGVRADIVASVMWFVSGVCVLLRYPNPWVANPESNPSSNPTTLEVEMPDIS